MTIHLTRLGPRELDDDNLAYGFKAVRDEIARQLGINDGDAKRLCWRYHNEFAPRKAGPKIRVEIVMGCHEDAHLCLCSLNSDARLSVLSFIETLQHQGT